MSSSMDVDEQLSFYRKKLIKALGPNEKQYWANVKAWFKHRISKDDFDSFSRKLLKDGDIGLHNKFFLAILTKYYSDSSTSLAPDQYSLTHKGKTNALSQAMVFKHEHRFIPRFSNFEPEIPLKLHQNHHKLGNSLSTPIHEKSRFIPNEKDLYPLATAISWEMHMDGSSEEVGKLLSCATEIFIKNLIMRTVSRRSSYTVLDEKFTFSVGREATNPYLLRREDRFESNSLRAELAEFKRVQNLGRTSQSCMRENIRLTMYDFHHALQYYRRNMIRPSTFFSETCEKSLAALYHPIPDEPVDVTKPKSVAVVPRSSSKRRRTTNN